MKFLVLTDLHQETANIPWINELVKTESPDAVLCLGDITNFGTGAQAADILSQIDCKVYALPGNCDPRELPASISEVAVDMHGKSAQIGEYHVAGLGGSNITIFDTPFELQEEEIDSLLRPISKEGMILMTHAPSYGILDHIPNGTSVGSPAIRKIVEDFKPVLALSGHIHEDFGTQKIDDTVFVNPGPAKDKRAAIIDMVGKNIKVKLIEP
ncbi:MAG: metallophosphoesterase family protein [archaeon]|nr:metallophosphoesterase family protein [archaeon]